MNFARTPLVRSIAFALLSAFFAGVPCQSQAQVAGTGVIAGSVANDKTKQQLQNAEVKVTGTNLVTLTGSDGSFRIAGVPAGAQQVEVTYTGLEPQTRSVIVAAGETQRLSFNLGSDVYELQRFVVAGDREGQARAINDQRNSDHIKSIVASDNFGDLVDSNAAELLKSVPGFAMSYAGEDAIGFVMRGQSSVYSSIMMDGNGIPNTGFGSRSINMRNVQVNNIESIEVNRAPDSSSPANSLGGSVNLVSKSAFSQQGRRIRIDLGANINTQLKQYGKSYQGFDYETYAQFPTGQINYSDTFRANTDHPIGVTVSALKGGRYRYNTQYTPSYTFVPPLATGQMVSLSTPAIASSANIQEASAGFRQDYYSVNFDFKLSENTTLYLRTYYQEGPQRHLYGINHRIVPTGGNLTSGTGAAMVVLNGNSSNRMDSRPNAVPVGAGSSTGSRIQKATGHEVSENQVYNVNVGGKTLWKEINFDYNAFLGRDLLRSPIYGFKKGGTLTYDLTNIGYVLDNIQSESEMTLTQTSGPDYKNVANYGRLAWGGTNGSRVDRKIGARINAKREFTHLRFPITLQGGYHYDLQKLTQSITGLGTRYTFGSGPDGIFGTGDDVALPLAQFADTRLNGTWNMLGFPSLNPGQFIDMAKLAAYVEANPSAATQDLVNDVISQYGNTKRFEESIEAMYFMATARFGKLTVVPGVRWERTNDQGFGYARLSQTLPAGLTLQQQADLVRQQYLPVTREVTYDDLYANLQAKYAVTKDFLLRAAYTQAIGRPNFGSLLPGDTINDTARTISRNNAALEPFNAENYDFTAEYYFDKSMGSLTASVFRKDIVNYFQSVTFDLPGGQGNGYNGLYEGYQVTEQRNIADTTRTEGFELGYQQALRFLPGVLKNVTASASYTHVKSTPPPGTLAATGIFPDVYNLGLTYNDSRLRVDLRYNMRKSWLSSINSTTGEALYFRDNDRIDLALNYRFTRKFTFYFDWRNFLDEEDLRYAGPDKRVQFHQVAGMSINAGIRAEF